MASFRSAHRLFRACQGVKVSSRGLQTKAGVSGTAWRAAGALVLGGAAVGGAYKAYSAYSLQDTSILEQVMPSKVAHAASSPESQPSVFSQGKDHALYLWIHLKPESNAKACAKAVAGLQHAVDAVSPPDMRDEEDEIWAGVGFGPNFYSQIAGKTRKNYNYPHRKSPLGEMPSSGGDIFVHAKSNNTSKLFELAQKVMATLPAESVECFEDTYSFVFKNGRDLSGFIDGTENAADDDDRKEIAVEKESGGSYVITQKWIHKLDVINKEKDATMEKWVGRTRNDSTEQSRKTISSHVARMTGGNGWEQRKPFQIVRQSMPYGNLHDKAGLFFIGYAASPENFEFMLDNMVGAGVDGHSDDIMRLTQCVKGTYWYFPGTAELKKLA